MPRALTRLGALVGALLMLTLWPVAAYAVDDAQIDHSEFTATQLKLLVSVPGADEIDFNSVSVQIGETDTEATAEAAEGSDDVQRTTVLAIDTSASMAGERIEEAKRAAETFLDTVPDNVLVGIVTFDNDVAVRQEPSLDRDASRAVLDDLELKFNTTLYRGVQTAIATAGTGDGQRQVLLLADGQDNTEAPLAPVVKAIRDSGVKLDVVSIQERGANRALNEMAAAGGGTVLNAADPAELTEAFSAEADTLARQVLITAALPEGVTDASATVAISLAAGGEPHTTQAFLAIRAIESGEPQAPEITAPVPIKNTFAIPKVAMYGALAAIGLGVLGVVFGLVFTGKPSRLSLQDQIAAYSAVEPGAAATGARKQAGSDVSLRDQAKQAAQRALTSNQGVEDKIALRLEGAGMALKAPEWVLLHAGIAFVVPVFGFLISGGNPFLTLLLLVLGMIGPWIYLGIKRSQRLRQFGQSLADTLQLMSGSLSAGLSLAQSLDTIVREGQEPMTSEFKRVVAETRLGVELEEALEGVAERMDSKDFHWVVMAIRIQREVGGNLAELLLTVAATLREREFLRRHVRALSAEGRLSCWILGGLPPGFLGYLSLTKPDYVNPMYTTPVGWIMLLGMGILLGVGIVWMMKVAKVEL